eukprot:SAG31_NODE_2777_length_5104_cov_3.012587_4_plen_89_part_00
MFYVVAACFSHNEQHVLTGDDTAGGDLVVWSTRKGEIVQRQNAGANRRNLSCVAAFCIDIAVFCLLYRTSSTNSVDYPLARLAPHGDL